MLIVMILVFLLGFILDFIEISFVVVPIVGPILIAMGADPLWLGIMLAINLQTSFLTPPFGFAFVLFKRCNTRKNKNRNYLQRGFSLYFDSTFDSLFSCIFSFYRNLSSFIDLLIKKKF